MSEGEDVEADFGIFDACHVIDHFRKFLYFAIILQKYVQVNFHAALCKASEYSLS